MMAPLRYDRLLRPRVAEALADTPVVLIHGPRQCGKTTLAEEIGQARGFEYFTFDDDVLAASARADPAGFVAGLKGPAVLDEVQRVPEIFTSLKAAVDREREPGRFLLTGSANVLLVRAMSESLAGRMEILRLHPLAQVEIRRIAPDFLRTLFQGTWTTRGHGRLGDELPRVIVGGGFPRALARGTRGRRAAWYRAYVDSLVQRDVRDLSRISRLDALPRLLEVAASQTARTINISELSAPFELSRPTIRDYVALLERVFLLEELPPWHSNRLSRLIKSPKLHMCDTGLACALVGVDERGLSEDRPLLGQMLETFVYQELRRQAGAAEESYTFHHYRDRHDAEVDIILESGDGLIAGVEVKASGTVHARDFRGLGKLRGAAGKRFASGVVLYNGEVAAPFGDGLHAVPIARLWEPD